MSKYFGTDGVRGDATNYLTKKLAYRIGRYIGQYPNGAQNKILIGRDTRLSGDSLDKAIVDGLLKSGAIVYELGITTTPSISYLVENGDFNFGIMISASHNPFTDNGIKIFSNNGEKLSSDIEDLIEEYIDSKKDYLKIYEDDYQKRYHDSSLLIDKYIDFVASKCYVKNKYRILLDCAHGSACVVAKKLFQEKLNQDVTIINGDFDGTDINLNCGSTHLQHIIEEMETKKYDVGFAFDGDADRLMCIAENGQIIDGDFLMFASSLNLKKHNKLNQNKIVITTMSNLGLKKALKRYGIGYEEVGVGDKYVQQSLKLNGLSLGGEQSGHVIFYSDLNTGCGLLSAVHFLNIIDEEQKSPSLIVKDMKTYPQLLKNIPVKNKNQIMSCQSLLDDINEVEKLLGDDGRILVRPSGTEQLIRVMVEAKDSHTCQKYVDKIIKTIKKLNN